MQKLGAYNNLSDREFIIKAFRAKVGSELNLDDPVTFREKLQWLKLYDHNPDYTRWVDKYEAKKMASALIGEEYIVPTIGVWDDCASIDFDALPEKFVLKCTHDSGGVVVCKDKSTLDRAKALSKLNTSLKRDYYKYSREWPYKNVKPRIIAENLLENQAGTELQDYKVFCCDGEPEIILVCSDRFLASGMKKDFYGKEWNKLALKRPDYATSEGTVSRPARFEDMLRLSRKIAEGKSFCRVDFYEVDAKLYFGELTFFPSSGFEGFEPEEYDRILGEKIHLGNISTACCEQ